MSKYVFSCIPTEYEFSPNTGKYQPEKTTYLNTFHAVIIEPAPSEETQSLTRDSQIFNKKNLPLVRLIKNCYPPKTQQDSITVPLYQAETKKCKHYKHCPRENYLNSENTQVSRKSSFSFSWRLFNFLNFIRTRPNMTYVTLREVWPWHLRSNIRKITDKIGLKFF